MRDFLIDSSGKLLTKAATFLLTFSALSYLAQAATHFVDITCPTPAYPYADWSSAATNIQDAVDAAFAGEQILVNNGVYQTGGRMVYWILSNRVAVTKPLIVQSVNGPGATIIQGFQVPGSTNGDGAIRCVYLTNGAVLAGFTLTNGATRTAGDGPEIVGGGVWCESTAATISNCVIIGNSALSGGGAGYGTLVNCTLSTNFATGKGGGTFWSTLFNCTLLGNYGTEGSGGAALGKLTGCTLIANSGSTTDTTSSGGGAANADVTNCTFLSNSATFGGGASSCTLFNCKLLTNSSSGDGGGADHSTLIDCTIIGNSAYLYGGGAYYSSLVNCLVASNSAFEGGGVDSGPGAVNCTIVGNSAEGINGGLSYTSATNSIIYYNSSPDGPNYSIANLYYSCVTPQPTNGFGNIHDPPLFANQLAGDFHLQSNSSCINAGFNRYAASAPELDGHARVAGGTVDIGAYEFPNPSSIISYAWLKQFGFATDGSADFSDPDGDQMNNWQEWIAGTNPKNALSLLILSKPLKSGSNIFLSWQSVTNKTYFLQRSTNLGQFAFTSLTTNITGRTGTTSFTDTNGARGGPYFYRVGVRF